MKYYHASWDSIRTHKLPQWYDDCKFGIFIHWGIYSVPAFAPMTWELGEVDVDEQWFCNNPYAEWYANSIRVKQGPTYEHHLKTYGEDFQYNQFIPMWKAENWQPQEWAKLFKQAGAKYVVLTTKHHDGFCLFPSKYSQHNSAIAGPKRDIMGELTQAVRNENLKMGAYYSGIIDWEFAPDPIFTESQNFSNACPTYEYADYAYKQVIELIDHYKPDLIWNDIGWPKAGEHMLPHLFAHYYNAVEEGVVNDRWNGLWNDFTCREYKTGTSSREKKWEMCRGMGLSFGYNQVEDISHIISLKKLVSMLVEIVANNGNLLLNIGPKADGSIPEEQKARLLQLGQWLAINGEGIYGTRCSKRHSYIDDHDRNIHFTCKENDLFVFIDQLSSGYNEVVIKNVSQPLQSLHPEVKFQQQVQGNHSKLIIENYRDDWNVLTFKAEQGE